MKKKRVNSEKGKVMNGHRLSEMERTKNSDSHLYLRFAARVSSVVAVFRAGTMSAAKKARCVGLAGPIAFSRPAQ